MIDTCRLCRAGAKTCFFVSGTALRDQYATRRSSSTANCRNHPRASTTAEELKVHRKYFFWCAKSSKELYGPSGPVIMRFSTFSTHLTARGVSVPFQWYNGKCMGALLEISFWYTVGDIVANEIDLVL